MDRKDLDDLAKAIQRTDWRTETEKLDALTVAWKYAKRMEQDWNQQRIAIESEIYALTEAQLPEKGTHTLDTGLKIATGYTEEWDQELLTRAYNGWQAPLPFPFAGQWKADGKAVTYLRENAPELYKIIQPALTLKPKKPAFSFKE
jgi:hypothetical protein